MACQLNILAKFEDLGCVKKYLYPHLIEEKKKDKDFEGWDDPDWGWQDDAEETAEKEATVDNSWLNKCNISLSPAADLLAVTKADRLVLLAQKWDSTEEEIPVKYHTVYEGIVRQEEGENITCVLCLPLASQKRSTQGGPDWTCVMVGFSSGYVRMYTETGALLLSQIFSEQPVHSIKCRTYEPPRHTADAEKHEELNILYSKALVTIDGFSFFQSLRACRNQVARAAASGSDMMQPPPLAYKKWGLHGQDYIEDHMPCGVMTPNPFDQMQTASMLGGYHASIRSTPPAAHVYVAAGKQPFVAYYFAMEGSAQPMLADVAHAVASKLKSALYSQISAASGWLGFGGKQTSDASKERKKPKIEPATSLPARYGLPDKRREGESIHVSPDSKLAVTTDSFGRVILIDVNKGIAVRMWKGYREAQVGWLEVREDVGTEQIGNQRARHVLFLVIYAPRRGIIEVWTCQQGPRVAAFNVSKHCRLLSLNHGMMGLNNVTFKEVRVNLNHLFLLDPEGYVKVIDVPFHLALSDKNSKRARDMHLLKKLKLALKETSSESGALQTEVIDNLLDIKIANIRQQGLERVLHTKYLSVSFLQTVLKALCQQLQATGELPMDDDTEKEEDQSMDYESRMLLHTCQAQQHLLNTYSALTKLEQPEADTELTKNENSEKIMSLLGLQASEWSEICEDIQMYQDLVVDESRRVKFSMDCTLTVTDFLSCFQCNTHSLPADSETRISLILTKGLTESRKLRLANFIYKSSLQYGASSDINAVLNDSHIAPDDLMHLLLLLWLSDDKRSADSTLNLQLMIKSVTALKDLEDITAASNEESAWWQTARNMCSETHRISAALLAALVCRAVAVEMSKLAMIENEMGSSTNSSSLDISEWEAVTVDKEQWSLLVRQLEDLLAVQALLKMKVDCQHAVDPISISVKTVIDGGRGVMPEYIAKWIASQGVLPSMLCLSQDEDKPEATLKRTDSVSPIVAQLQCLQRRLPHSLGADILMANCAWEYIVLWNKDVEVTFPLEQALAFLKCMQNAMLQHGVASMMWHMFILKKLSATAMLIEKVGKAPKDRLCRRDVGLSETSLDRFVVHSVELLDIILQSCQDATETLVLNVEDLWQHISGSSSLAELALEQKASNMELVEHHYYLAISMHAIFTFSIKSIRPLSLFDTKGKNAFFKPLHASPLLPSRIVDETILEERKRFMCRVISHAVQSLRDTAGSPSPSNSPPASPPTAQKNSKRERNASVSSLGSPSRSRNLRYSRWPPLMLRLAKDLAVDMDYLRRHHVIELYSSGHDKLAEEVLLTVSDHASMGSQLLLIAGQRLHHFVFVCDPADSVEKLAKCSTTMSSWLRNTCTEHLSCPNPPLSDTAAMISQLINQLPECHSNYNLAIELVELLQAFL